MFMTKLNIVLLAMLVGTTLAGQMQANEERPDKGDQERMMGNWHIVNDDSLRKGEMWVISKDRILMHAKNLGANSQEYSHRLDAGKDPKQIDITVTKVNGPPIGVIKGIYALDGDELRLCLAEMGKDRPAAFPEKPGPGELLILHREKPGAEPPKAKEEQSAKTDQERMVGNWFIVNEDGGRRKGEMWVITEDTIRIHTKDGGLGGLSASIYSHRLDAAKDPKQIDINVISYNGSDSALGIVKGIYVLDGDELRLCLGVRGQDRPAAFPKKPGPGEVLVLHRAPEPQAEEQAAAKKDEPPKANKEPEVLTPAEAIKQADKEQVTVRFEVASIKMGWSTGLVSKRAKTTSVWWELNDGNNFSVVLRGHAAWQLEQLRIDTINHFKGKAIQATGRVQGKEPPFYMKVDDLDQLEVVR
jgi:uncharacterized protein (TIGR03067 family)